MFYKTKLLIPRNTSITSPVSVSFKLTYGVIKHWWILFRPGNPELAQIQILHRMHHLIPTSPDEWLSADNYVFSIPDQYELFDDPFELTVYGYNLDVAFPHTILVHAVVLPPPRPRPQRFLQRLFGQGAPIEGA